MRWLVVLVLVAGCSTKREEAKRQPAPSIAKKPVKPTGCENPGGSVCVDDDVVECLDSGQLGVTLQRCNGGCNAGACRETCAIRDAELIYVVDDQRTLWSFDPRKLPNDPLHQVGALECERGSTPFSMAVDRMGIAWVLYHSGRVYRVSIIDAKCSQAASPVGAPTRFGMGFVSDGPNATTEKLFVAEYGAPNLAELDIKERKPVWKPVGRFLQTEKNPELSGTGGGQLFGFFPEDGDNAFVSEIDRTSGELVGKRMRVGSPKGTIGAWAFAHWGGSFYVFVTIDNNSRVYVVDGKTGESTLARERLPSRIVGAGVSTCAPLLEQPAQ